MLRDRPPELGARFTATVEQLWISTIVLAELLVGAARPAANRREVDRFADRLEVLPFDASAAGPARSRGLVVVTANLREFRRVEGLRCEDWLTPAPP